MLILFAITTESIADQQHDFRIKDSEKYKLSLEAIADKISARKDLVAVNGDDNPQLMYFAHRKGWTITTKEAINTSYVDELVQKGCKFLILNKHADFIIPSSSKSRAEVFEDENFVIYSLVIN